MMSSSSQQEHPLSRRIFLRRTGTAVAGLGLGGVGLLSAGCDEPLPGQQEPIERQLISTREGSGPVRRIHLTAAPGEVDIGPDETYQTWLYDGRLPGPEIRASEGEQLEITINNQLPAPTTTHWHGLPVPNAMDGVPGVTQEPIEPGESFTYRFDALPPGTYIYHSHVGLQLDRGLLGIIIVEENEPHVDYDRDHTLVLDDYLPDPPEPLGASDRDRGMRGRGMMGRGMMGQQMPPYQALLINGQRPEAPASFDTRRGERVRLRVANASSATVYRFAIGEHRLTVTHADGRPVEPVTVDAFRIGPGERYDVVAESDNPGAWPIAAAPLEHDVPPARATFRYTDAARNAPPEGALPDGLRNGRLLQYADLQALERLDLPESVHRRFDLQLSGGMMMQSDVWTIDGQAYPDADPLPLQEGEHVRVNLSNMSMMLHPMHLHGHFFRVGGAIKDTVLVDPHMGRATFDFVADNPGDWLFHCHNIYHMEAGMARIFRYV